MHQVVYYGAYTPEAKPDARDTYQVPVGRSTEVGEFVCLSRPHDALVNAVWLVCFCVAASCWFSV